MKLNIPNRTQFGPDRGVGATIDMSHVQTLVKQAEAGRQISGAFQELSQRLRDTRNATELNTRILQAKQKYQEWSIERQMQANDFETLEQESTDLLKTLGDEVMDGVTDRDLSIKLSNAWGQFSLNEVINAKKTALDQEVNYHKGSMEYVGWQLRKNISLETDEEERASMTEQGVTYFQDLAASGVILPQEAEKKTQEFLSGLVEDEVQGVVYNSPDAALRLLQDDNYTKNMDPQTRTRLMDSAQRRQDTLIKQKIAAMEKAERDQERAFDDYQEANYAVGFQLITSGEMTYDQLDRWRAEGKIKGSDFVRLTGDLDAITEAGGPGNAERFNEHRLRVYSGQVENPADLVHVPPGETPLNTDQIQELQDLYAQGPAATRSNEYRAAQGYVENMLGVFDSGPIGQLIGSPQVVAAAKRELYIRAQEDPRIDIDTVANEIVTRYLDKYKNQVGRQMPVKYETFDELWQAFQNQAIGEEEYELQATLLKLRDMGGDNQPEDFSQFSTRKEEDDGQ